LSPPVNGPESAGQRIIGCRIATVASLLRRHAARQFTATGRYFFAPSSFTKAANLVASSFVIPR